MKYLTIFSDIHANLPSLQAVIADMDQRELENRYCLGDLVGYGTFPNEVVDFIRNSKTPTILGNYDQGVGNSSDDCGCAYKDEASKALGQRSIAWTTSERNSAMLYLMLRFPILRSNASIAARRFRAKYSRCRQADRSANATSKYRSQ